MILRATEKPSEAEYFVEVHLKYTDSMNKNTGFFPLCLKSKKGKEEFFTGFMKKYILQNKRLVKKLICD